MPPAQVSRSFACPRNQIAMPRKREIHTRERDCCLQAGGVGERATARRVRAVLGDQHACRVARRRIFREALRLLPTGPARAAGLPSGRRRSGRLRNEADTLPSRARCSPRSLSCMPHCGHPALCILTTASSLPPVACLAGYELDAVALPRVLSGRLQRFSRPYPIEIGTRDFSQYMHIVSITLHIKRKASYLPL